MAIPSEDQVADWMTSLSNWGRWGDDDPPERQRVRRGASEFIGMVFHGQTIIHIDSRSHYWWQGRLYNGRPASLITSREGAQTHSMGVTSDGIVSRGVLLDIARLRNEPWLALDDAIMPEDLEAAEALEGARVEERISC